MQVVLPFLQRRRMGSQPGVIGVAAMEPDRRLARGVQPLPRGSLLRVENGQGTLVRTRYGRVWLTQEGERHDVLLEAGQQFTITRGGATLIEALHDSVVTLASSHEKRFARLIR